MKNISSQLSWLKVKTHMLCITILTTRNGNFRQLCIVFLMDSILPYLDRRGFEVIACGIATAMVRQ